MNKHSVMEKRTEVSCRQKIVLDYSLILTDKHEKDLFEEETVYSILILQLEGGITTEYEFLYDVARNEENAVAILNTLVYNDVMPSNARDVLTDLL